MGILRWAVAVPPDGPGEIVDCGLAMLESNNEQVPYWCNALCTPIQSVAETDATITLEACVGSECPGTADTCSDGYCTGGGDCRPELAP